MIYTRYHKARAAKIAAERALIEKQDAEIRGEAPVQTPAAEPPPQPAPAEPVRPTTPQQQHQKRR